MKRRYWPVFAIALNCIVLPAASAQDRILPEVPGSKSTTTPGESAAKTAEGIPAEGIITDVTEEYRPSFSERMAGFRDAMFKPISFNWFSDWAGTSEPLLSSDIEDPYWAKAEMLFGWFPKANAPALLTTSLPQESRGILGNEGTSVLFGESINSKVHYGTKVTIGWWSEPSQSWGFEGSAYFLAARTNRYLVSPQGDPLLAAPFFDALNNQQSSFVIANETLNDDSLQQQSGSVQIGLTNRFYGAELNNLHNITRGTRGRVDWSWGYRYLRFDEEIYNEVRQSQSPPVGQNFGTQSHFYDLFSTENEFQGFNVGIRSQWWWGCWSFDVNGKLALGITRSTVSVFGRTLSASPPQFQIITTSGGIYALTSNIGDETFNRLSIIPEIELGVGYQVTDHARFTLNYNFLAFNNVMRAGEQIDNRINPNIFDGNSGNPAMPVRLNQATNMWIQTFSFGVEYRY